MMMTDPVLEVLKPGAAAVNAAEVTNPESDAVFATDAGKAVWPSRKDIKLKNRADLLENSLC